jgi:DNA polymerase elongation subunit (family B)
MNLDLEIHAYEINTEDYLDENDELKTEILIWSFNKESEPILARVKGFPVFCKVELPLLRDRSGFINKWDEISVQNLFTAIKKKLESKEVEEPLSMKLIKAQKLYYYTGNKKYPFLFMTFNTLHHMHTVKKICKYIYINNCKLELKFVETDVDIYNKMFSCQNCSTTDKITCKGQIIDVEDERRISKPGVEKRPFKEYIIDWKSIKKSEGNWYSTPIVMSFDIETYSHNHRCFPEKHYHEDVIFSISMTIQVFMKPETKKDIVIIIGPTQKVKDVEIIYAKDEFDVLNKFCEIVQKEDPDIFIGYNIFGFDYDYMNTRLEDVGLEWPNIGRLIEKGCSMEELSWNSSAYGFQKLKIFNCPGRISVDMLPYIKRDYKLPLYNLSAVGKYFLGEEKYDLKAYEMFAIHKKVMLQIKVLNEITKSDDYVESVKILKNNHSEYDKKDLSKILDAISKNTLIVKYNVQDTLLVTRLFEKLNVWIALIESASIFRVTPMVLFTRGQQKRCVSQLYHFASHQNYVLTTRENVWQYAVGGYVGDPVVGFHDPVVCYDFNSLYPSIIIANNLCYTTLLKSIADIDPKIYKRFDVVQNEPLDPKPKKNDDFDYDGFYEKEEPESKEKIERKYQFGFVKPEIKKGLLPTILTDLLGQRKKVKKERKKVDKKIDIIDKYILALYKENEQSLVSDIKHLEAKELFKKFFDCKEDEKIEKYIKDLTRDFFTMKVNSDILDSRQLSLKVSANSMYGFTLAQTMGKLPIVEIGMTITYEGRRMIIDAGLYFEKNYGVKVVYGDSIPGYEPVLLKNNKGDVFIEEIQNLVEESEWIHYEGFKVGESNRREKSQAFVNLFSWSKGKWNKIVRIIRHRTNKNIYRIKTFRIRNR